MTFRWLSLALLPLLALSLSACTDPDAASKRGPDPREPNEHMDALQVLPFELVNQDEQPVTDAILEGRYSVVDFIFTNCPFICPTMAVEMSRLSEDLGAHDIQFISISVDPTNDTPDRLRQYGSNFTDDFDRWMFLTGDRSLIWSLLGDGLQFNIDEDPNTPVNIAGGGTMANINHPAHLILIGPNKRVLGIYHHNFRSDMDELAERLRLIAPTRE